MATEIEVSGGMKSVAEPTDVASLHTKDVGVIKGKLEDFATTFIQPPMSRFYGVLDLDKTTDAPDMGIIDFSLLKNQSYERQFTLDRSKGTPPGPNVLKLNTFDAEVLREALKIVQVLLSSNLDKGFEEIARPMSDFNGKFEGNIANV